MAAFRFIGDPRHGGEGPDGITAFDLSFSRVYATNVSDARLIAKLAGNPHFIQDDANAAPSPDAVVVREPSGQKRPRKSRRAQGAA
jgi:hypothetical protein